MNREEIREKTIDIENVIDQYRKIIENNEEILRYLDETKKDIYIEKEFKIWQLLQEFDKHGLSQNEKIKKIAFLID